MNKLRARLSEIRSKQADPMTPQKDLIKLQEEKDQLCAKIKEMDSTEWKPKGTK